MQPTTVRWCQVLCAFILILHFNDADIVRTSRCSAVRVKNGRTRYRQKSGFMQTVCNKGFILAGDKYMKCSGGRWEGQIPVCVRNTCEGLREPTNGFVYPSHRGAVHNFFCKPDYELVGPAMVYCDGKAWSSHLPICKLSNKTISLDCDFEVEDLCGWTHDLNHNFDWTRHNRATPSSFVGTGPAYDHTLGAGKAGHYMYIEASSKAPSDTARLISPVHASSANNMCLEFWYHMYGMTMGELRVYVNDMRTAEWNFTADRAIWTRAGNHGNRWLRAFVELGARPDDAFQVIFEGVRGGNYMSDTAIDDVRVIEDCVLPSTTEYYDGDASTADYATGYVEGWSCYNRCENDTAALGMCTCTPDCYELESCCPDYEAYCLDRSESPFAESSSTAANTELFEVDTSTMDTSIGEITVTQGHTVESLLTKAVTEVIVTSRTTTTTTTSTPRPTTTPSTTLKTTTRTAKPATPSTRRLTPTTTRPTTTTRRVTTTSTKRPTPSTTTRPTTTMKAVVVVKKTEKTPSVANEVAPGKLHLPASDDSSSGGSGATLLVCTVGGVLIVAGAMLAVRWRHHCRHPLQRMRRAGGYSGDSQSDVRFLTSDEALDFSIATSTL